MNRPTGLLLVTALAIAPLPVAAASAAGTGVALPRVMTCAGTTVVRPSSYVLACADDYTYFVKIHWTTWSTASATARATFVQNNCTPTCVTGHFVKYPARLTFSEPKKTRYGRLFSKIDYHYTISVSSTLPLEPLSAVTGTSRR